MVQSATGLVESKNERLNKSSERKAKIPLFAGLMLQAKYKDQLVFVSVDGKQINCARSGYQGKKEYLKVGEWFILSGEKRSEPAFKKQGSKEGI